MQKVYDDGKRAYSKMKQLDKKLEKYIGSVINTTHRNLRKHEVAIQRSLQMPCGCFVGARFTSGQQIPGVARRRVFGHCSTHKKLPDIFQTSWGNWGRTPTQRPRDTGVTFRNHFVRCSGNADYGLRSQIDCPSWDPAQAEDIESAAKEMKTLTVDLKNKLQGMQTMVGKLG